MQQFLEKYGLVDDKMSSYDDNTKQMIAEILNGNIDDYINSENSIAQLYIGLQYKYIKKDIILAEKYYLLASEQNCSLAMNNLAVIYWEEVKLDLAEKYCVMAIERNCSIAMSNLGLLYSEQKKWTLAEKYYIMAAEHYNSIAMRRLAILYVQQSKEDLAEKYYLMAIEHGDKLSLHYLGNLYEGQKKFDLAMKYFRKDLLFDARTIEHVIGMIPKLSNELQLETLELVPQIRANDEYFYRIPIQIRQLFADKKMEMQKCLSPYLMNDVRDICLVYY